MTRRLPWKREQGGAAPESPASPRWPDLLATLPSRWRSPPVQEAEQAPFHADALSRVDNTQEFVLRDHTRDSVRDRSSGPKLEERAAGGSDGNATDDEDDLFSIKRRRTRRERSRAQLRNNDDTRHPKDLLSDTIPSFL